MEANMTGELFSHVVKHGEWVIQPCGQARRMGYSAMRSSTVNEMFSHVVKHGE